MNRVARLVRDQRPAPPDTLATFDDFAADQGGLGAWARRTFIDADGVLANERHAHLREAEIGWLWTTAEARNRNRMIAGECRLVPPQQKKWSSALAQWNLVRLFGAVPDFVITIDAAMSRVDDWAFCALIEHELCHAAQDADPFGTPRFTREGRPIFRVVAHDVEEFVDVVARYGAAATGTRDLVAAAAAGPTIGAAAMGMACGTCNRKAA